MKSPAYQTNTDITLNSCSPDLTWLCSQVVSWLHFLPGRQFSSAVWTLPKNWNLKKTQPYCKSSEVSGWIWACSSTRITLDQCVCRCFNHKKNRERRAVNCKTIFYRSIHWYFKSGASMQWQISLNQLHISGSMNIEHLSFLFHQHTIASVPLLCIAHNTV